EHGREARDEQRDPAREARRGSLTCAGSAVGARGAHRADVAEVARHERQDAWRQERHEAREERDREREDHRAGERGLGEALPEVAHGASARSASTSGRTTPGSTMPTTRTATRPFRSSRTVVGVALIGTTPSRAARAAPSASSIEG